MVYRLSSIVEVFQALPLWFLIFGIFTPVALLLLLIIAYFRLELMQVNNEIAMNEDPMDFNKERYFNKHSTEYRARNVSCDSLPVKPRLLSSGNKF
ncbi:small leucine-rich protein 1-like isoform X2 [Pristis pectinata]|uniref:small leucine-rich protein 1-like isoform X2 n=1 Tax=Pristis pectinata TaxID=685728 RepID=UPI00223E071D|nr:small leucine-rich protein 1-like isoform X2 [Pristis pectinata]